MPKGGKSARRKGSEGEREIVRLLRESDIRAKKVPLSGAIEGFKDDVLVGVGKEQLRAEVKRRRDGWRELYTWLNGPDLLFMRADRKSWLVCMPYGEFVKLWNKKKGNK